MKAKVGANTRRNCSGFSLVEQMVAVMIISMVIAGAMTIHIFGLRLYNITEAKLSSGDEARRAISLLIDEIRSAKIVRVGSGSLTSFSGAGVDSEQQGSAIQIYPTTNTAEWIRYYWDSTDQKLKRTEDGLNSYLVIAQSISNSIVFTSEDYSGTVLTNNQNNRVIGLTMEFEQVVDLTTGTTNDGLYDYYRLRAKITRRALE